LSQCEPQNYYAELVYKTTFDLNAKKERTKKRRKEGSPKENVQGNVTEEKIGAHRGEEKTKENLDKSNNDNEKEKDEDEKNGNCQNIDEEKNEVDEVTEKIFEEIEKDLHRSFQLHPSFQEDGDGVPSLRRVLRAYSSRNRKV
jgi:arylsulfatase A-like enzyme